ncbi:MAG: peptidase T [Nonlabens sp.]
MEYTDKDALLDRFISYVTIDAESDPDSDTTRSTAKQGDMARLLHQQLLDLGLEATIDEKSYVMATLPSNAGNDLPVIGFISHFDTTPDFTGEGINPQVIENYDGKDIQLGTSGLVLSPDYFEELKNYKGQTLVTTDGTTLLAADDKAGITEIMCAVKYLIDHPEIKHGAIKIGFTPDEEIGRGAHHFDVEKFGADWAYTMDGSTLGELEFENFNAAGAVITISGKIVHPGYAKGKMVNSIYIAQRFINQLPKLETPEHTEGYQGFFHLHHMEGSVEKTVLHYIVRDHDQDHFEARKNFIASIAVDLNEKLGKELITVEVNDQYYNMKEKIEPVMHIIDLAAQAMRELDIEPLIKPIRGGTDGSQLSFKGLPCPNIFAGGHNFHGPYEYVPVESMVAATNVIIKIAQLATKR